MAIILSFTIALLMEAATPLDSDLVLWPNLGLAFVPANVLVLTGEKKYRLKYLRT